MKVSFVARVRPRSEAGMWIEIRGAFALGFIIGAAEFVARAGRRISRPIGPRKTKAKLEALLKRMHPPNDSSSPTG